MAQCCSKAEVMVKDTAPYCRVMLNDIQHMTWNPSPEPACIYDFLYLGDGASAMSVRTMERLGITCVINTCAHYIETGPEFYEESGIAYVGINAEDEIDYDIMQHFAEVYDVIERERKAGGKVYIHCIAGVNRSGALTVAYCMVHEKWGPIKASRFVRGRRERLLSNDEFQRQLVAFANEKSLLILDEPLLAPPNDEKTATKV